MVVIGVATPAPGDPSRFATLPTSAMLIGRSDLLL